METEPIILMIDAASIDMSAAPDMNKRYFWNHHRNTKEDYLCIADKIPAVTQSLKLGSTEEKIKSNPALKDTYIFGCGCLAVLLFIAFGFLLMISGVL